MKLSEFIEYLQDEIEEGNLNPKNELIVYYANSVGKFAVVTDCVQNNRRVKGMDFRYFNELEFKYGVIEGWR